MAIKNFKITVSKDNRDVIKRKLEYATKEALAIMGEHIVDRVREYAPKDTGALSQSYVVEEHDNYIRVGSPLHYAAYVELGTGPYYGKPPKWIENNAEEGYHTIDPWWYVDENDGEWHLGWFIPPQPHLQPAIVGHAAEYRQIFKDILEHAK